MTALPMAVYNPSTMGSVPNVGVMAQKAEEYGSHDKTLKSHQPEMLAVGAAGTVLMSHQVDTGDIWRMCTVKDLPIRTKWCSQLVGLMPLALLLFLLNESRASRPRAIAKVRSYLNDHDTDGLRVEIASRLRPQFSVDRIDAAKTRSRSPAMSFTISPTSSPFSN